MGKTNYNLKEFKHQNSFQGGSSITKLVKAKYGVVGNSITRVRSKSGVVGSSITPAVSAKYGGVGATPLKVTSNG